MRFLLMSLYNVEQGFNSSPFYGNLNNLHFLSINIFFRHLLGAILLITKAISLPTLFISISLKIGMRIDIKST